MSAFNRRITEVYESQMGQNGTGQTHVHRKGLVRAAATLLTLTSLISGCDWPSITLNADGLGDRPIGNYLREAERWNHNELELKRDITELILWRFSTRSLSREEAESLGTQCEKPPGTVCGYFGEMSYRLSGLPQASPLEGKRTIVQIAVRFSYLKPQEIFVQKREREEYNGK